MYAAYLTPVIRSVRVVPIQADGDGILTVDAIPIGALCRVMLMLRTALRSIGRRAPPAPLRLPAPILACMAPLVLTSTSLSFLSFLSLSLSLSSIRPVFWIVLLVLVRAPVSPLLSMAPICEYGVAQRLKVFAETGMRQQSQ